MVNPVEKDEKIKRNISLHVKKLKCLRNVTVDLSSPLTAIMGVNGSGKTTVIHALACMYQPVSNGENYKFPFFFVPNTDATWAGSKMSLSYQLKDQENQKKWTKAKKEYEKRTDRWTRYEDRPKREVFYIGIDSCTPDIELKTTSTNIHYASKVMNGKINQKVLDDAKYVLNKDYSLLLSNSYKGKMFVGVETSSKLRYSSLSMGTGEQRTFKILEKLHSAPRYSMILIDEIDLLLHVSAFRRLIEKISEIAISKNLQIVFTTHSIDILNMGHLVNIQYLSQSSDGKKTLVYNHIDCDLIYDMTSVDLKPIKIFVEDSYSKCVVHSVARKLGILTKVDLVSVGSADNLFVVAASQVMERKDVSNVLVVLDGDKYSTEENKNDRMKKVMTGNEPYREELRKKALDILTQYALPKGVAPEKFMHGLLVKYGNKSSDVVKTAVGISAVEDSHQWVDAIVERIGLSEGEVISQMIQEVSEKKEWKEYVFPIEKWLTERKDV